MKRLHLDKLIIIFLFFSLTTAKAQGVSIIGASSANINDTSIYSRKVLSGTIVYGGTWTVSTGGSILSQSNTSATIKWLSSGTKTITFNALSLNFSTIRVIKSVVIAGATVPLSPPSPIIANQNCTNATLQKSGTIPTGEMWYWQGTSSLGTGTNYPATSNYNLTSTGRYYLRARNTSTLVWSTSSSSIYVTLGTIGGTTWYADSDDDNLGDPNVSTVQCNQPVNYVSNNNDQCPTEHGGGSISGCPSSASLSNENYVYTVTPQIPVTSTSQIALNKHAIKNVTYFDGIGRPIQSIGIKQSNSEKDIVNLIAYDAYGRQKKEYLLYSSITNNGFYKISAESDTKSYYQVNYGTDINATNPNPFSEKAFDGSSLNRVKKQAAPGYDWRMGGGHEIKFDYTSNAGSEVRLYTVILNSGYTPTLSGGTSYYQVGLLYKTITKDENHSGTTKDRTTEEFKDKQGRVILKRTYDAGVAHDTYYVYDDYGNLTYVLPPKAEPHSAKPDATELLELCYQYKYDNRNRLVEKKIPGKGWEYIIYDKLDRPILIQDANQRAKSSKEWLFTKYDIFGRVVYTGLYKDNRSRIDVQASVDVHTTIYEARGNALYHYTNNAYPTVISYLDIHTVNYYDDYDYWKHDLTIPATVYGIATTTNLKGLITGVKSKVLETDKWIMTITGHDDKGQVIYVASKNEYLGTTDIIENKLDFTGKVLETKTTHKKTGKADIVTIDTFEYDHTGRLLENKQYINGNNGELITRNHYDELGQLIKKDVGGTLNSSQTQFKDVVNLDVSGLMITKTYNSTSWNGGLATVGEISNDGYIEYEMPQTGKYLMVGLSSDNSSASYNTIDFAIYHQASSNVYIYESGSNKGKKTTYKIGDIFRVERIGNTVFYKKNGVTFYTSTTTSSGKLIGDISMYHYQGKVNNLHISSTYKDLVSVTVTDDTVTSTAGTGWNSGFATTESFSNDGYVQYEITQTGKYLMAGLSTDNTNANYNTIDYAIYHYSTNKLYVYESGANRGYKTTYAVGDILKIERKGTTIYYKKNDVTFYTSTIASTGALIGDTSFYHNQGKIKNLRVQSSGLQTIDYDYNIRGWLKEINDVNSLGSDLFSFKVNYNTPTTGTALYNGNISQTQWKTDNTDSSLKTYSYIYDALNRIKTATDNTAKYNIWNILYDKNGNLMRLYRKGHTNVGATSFGNMDLLSYTYQSRSNKLTKVIDNGSDGYGFKDGTNTGNDYTYDVNGNMKTDANKGITNITYNHLNLPTRIIINGGNISYIYDASGVKLRKMYSDVVTDYAGNYVYEDNTLQFFNHPEGYVSPNTSGTFDYVYQYKDHLGNIRLSYSDSDGNGTISQSEIIEENNYYPFGLKHKGYNNVINGAQNNYMTYNGKEWNESLGIDMYEMDVRQYDPAIARWISMDPVIHPSVSPYQAFDNNPVFWSDPSGADGEHYNWDTGEYEDDQGNVVSFAEAMASIGLNADGSQASTSDSGGGCDDCSKCPETCNDSKKSVSKYPVSVDMDGTMEASLATGLAISRVDGPLKFADVVGGAYVLNTMIALGLANWTAGKINDGQTAILLTYDTNWLYAKQDKEIQRILSKTGGPPGMTYALLVNVSGNYLDVRGNSVFLNAGDVWKYGETSKGIDGRYPGDKLSTMIPGGVTPRPLFFGNTVQIKVQEKIMIYGHALSTGKLPPGNRIFR